MSLKELPLDWMLCDLQEAIDHGAIYLAALGLAVYTEMLGREALHAKGKGGSDGESFNHFVTDYMGYPRSLLNGFETHNCLRNGLAHLYYLKGEWTLVAEEFEKSEDPSGDKPGLDLNQDSTLRAIVVKPYFRDFKKGVEAWRDEKQRFLGGSVPLPFGGRLPAPVTHQASAQMITTSMPPTVPPPRTEPPTKP